MSAPDLTDHVTLDSAHGPTNAYGLVRLGTFTDPATKDPKRVAVKYLMADSAEEQERVAKRIEREAAIWVMLSHPNIVPFFGKYALKPPPAPAALVYLYCPGASVLIHLGNHPDADRSKLVLDIAKGFHYLHQADVIHGDFSPTNVLIRENGVAAIAHFGRAKIIGYRGLSTNTRGGSRYTSPEAWDLKGTTGITKEADIYAFGITALHLLSGKLPYEFVDEDDIWHCVAHNQKILKHEDFPKVPSAWWDAIEECWEYTPSSRPTMSEVHELLITL